VIVINCNSQIGFEVESKNLEKLKQNDIFQEDFRYMKFSSAVFIKNLRMKLSKIAVSAEFVE
jgi:hypothetical protein